MEYQENYGAYNPEDLATNAFDFEEPKVFGNEISYDDAYKSYYDDVRKNAPVEKSVDVLEDKKESYDKSYKLKKPFNFEGEWITEVYLDLDNLTGKDIMDASRGVDSFVQETDKRYLCAVAAKAMKRPKEIMYYMSAKDVTAICYFISDFLID